MEAEERHVGPSSDGASMASLSLRQQDKHQQRMNENVVEATSLVEALRRVRDQGRKSNVRSTDHLVPIQQTDGGSVHSESAIVQEAADEDEQVDDARSRAKPHSSNGYATLTSWKTQEFAYRKTTKVGIDPSNELPTLARGLFTMGIGASGQDVHRIVVRGYDKFFNEGEMPWTRPQAIAAYSCPPYELSFKENGCIIFIAALSPHQLIVTSKHSLGANESHYVSHAQKGEEWLDSHLASKGKSKKALAAELWQRNETAVAELCDDDFEEHVLPYPAERTGLHLHGLNANSAHFQTRSMAEVETFAIEWGFLPTRYILIDSLADVEKFCRSVAESGSWQGIPLEGFVVRTRVPHGARVANGSAPVAPPYQPGQVWFYKVKFDEPYLMYRDWRELTRRMLADKQKYDKARTERGLDTSMLASPHDDETLAPASIEANPSTDKRSKVAKKKELKKAEQTQRAAQAASGLAPPAAPQARSNRAETKLYVQWCYEKLYGSPDGKVRPDPELFESFNQNKGIIRLRQEFIRYVDSPQGRAKLTALSTRTHGTTVGAQDGGQPTAATAAADWPFDKTLLVPIAVPGCGKTVLGVALNNLIPDFGHTQSDDVRSKKTAPTFLKNIMRELDSHAVVFADRNNHLFKHRNEIVASVQDWQSKAANKAHRVRLVALAWALDALPLNAIHHLCSERIVHRGDNHQSLRSSASREHEQVLWNFMRQLEPFGSAMHGGGDEGHGDGAFDVVIRMDVNASLEQNITKAYRQLTPLLGLPVLEQVKIDEAISKAMEHKVTIKKEIKGAPLPPVRYYALAIEIDVVAALRDLLKPYPDAFQAFLALHDARRVIARPHVTLVHSSELKSRDGPDDAERQRQAQKRWDTYSAHATAEQPPKFDISVDLIAWDDKAMALGAYDVRSVQVSELNSLQGPHWRPHITIGTFAEEIRPFEANRVLREADANDANVHSIRFAIPLSLTARVKGMS